jgi:hypothetical protein
VTRQVTRQLTRQVTRQGTRQMTRQVTRQGTHQMTRQARMTVCFILYWFMSKDYFNASLGYSKNSGFALFIRFSVEPFR